MRASYAVCAGVCLSVALIGLSSSTPSALIQWTKFVRVDGQAQPVPEQWLKDDESRVAHSLRLPDAANPGPIPFNFAKAELLALLPKTPTAAVQYWNHLCETEAGEWILRKVSGVEGFYFARPAVAPSTEALADSRGLEMPWIQRIFLLSGDASAKDQGLWFIQPPLYNYRFIEQPRRSVRWQFGIDKRYIRLFGYMQERQANPYVLDSAGKPATYYKEVAPMKVIGIDRLQSRFGYTWRGLKRERDREYGIAGGEILIYDLQTREVLAVRRQFLISGRHPGSNGRAAWEVAAKCKSPESWGIGAEFTQFAFDVLETLEPSSTRSRKP